MTASAPPSGIPGSRLRATVIASGMLVALALLAGRFFYLQVMRHDQYHSLSVRQSRSVIEVPAPRGRILAANGESLAVDRTLHDLVVSPRDAGDSLPGLLERIAPILERSAGDLAAELSPYMDRFYRVVARDLDADQLIAVRELENSRGRLPRGLILEERQGRFYTQGRLAAQVLGFVNLEGRGASGIELSADGRLRGKPGKRQVLYDARRIAINPGASEWIERPQSGEDIRLTLRLPVQLAAEIALDQIQEEFDPSGSIAVVLEVKTGDLVALASRPTFDPNQIRDSDPESWKIRAITDAFEPGSTFKTFTVATAIDNGAVSLSSGFDCEGGSWWIFGRRLTDTHASGWLSVLDILVESSNIGASKVALSLCKGDDTAPAKHALHAYLTGVFGFGSPTGVGLPGEIAGMVRPPEKWDNMTLTSVPMGYEVMVTPLQLASAYATIAAGGIRRRVRLIDDTHASKEGGRGAQALGERGEVASGEGAGIRVLDMSDPDKDVRRALAEVVRRGTARRVAPLSRGEMAGKTGTTHKVDPVLKRYVDRYVSSFVGFAPVEDPRYVCLIVVDEPKGKHYGGSVAAPGVRDILDRALEPHFSLDADAGGTDRRKR